MSLQKVLEFLYSEEHNVQISSFCDGGWEFKLGDERNGFREIGHFDSLDQGRLALEYLGKNNNRAGKPRLQKGVIIMGQRHQIYLRLPAMYSEDNPNHQPIRVVGIHHQWLWGQTAMKLLVNFLTFLEKSENKYAGRDVLEILQCAYAIHPETGYFHGICPELDKNENPMNTDNNNGVTIIDLTGKKPKYCFMSLHYLECLDDDVDEEKVPNLEPFDAKTYIGLHYKNFALVKEDKFFKFFSHQQNKYVSIKNFMEFQRHNSKATKKEYENAVKENQDFRKQTRKLVAFLSRYEVLTKKEVQEIFPAMFPEVEVPKKGRKLLNKSKKNAAMHVS